MSVSDSPTRRRSPRVRSAPPDMGDTVRSPRKAEVQTKILPSRPVHLFKTDLDPAQTAAKVCLLSSLSDLDRRAFDKRASRAQDAFILRYRIIAPSPKPPRSRSSCPTRPSRRLARSLSRDGPSARPSRAVLTASTPALSTLLARSGRRGRPSCGSRTTPSNTHSTCSRASASRFSARPTSSPSLPLQRLSSTDRHQPLPTFRRDGRLRPVRHDRGRRTGSRVHGSAL